jgi:signal transduction histidine kinase
MKLRRKINLSFALLILVMVCVTAVAVYSLLLRLLVQDQESELKAKGEAWIAYVQSQDVPVRPRDVLQLAKIPIRTGKTDVFLMNVTRQKVIFTTLGEGASQSIRDMLQELRANRSPLWKVGKEKYIAVRLAFRAHQSQYVLILATKVKGIQIVQWFLMRNLLLVLMVGGTVALLLGTYFTRRIIKPLLQVRNELHKVRERQFADVRLVKADGEIGEVAQAVYSLSQELDRYIAAQKQFFQNASHEIKTPLASIQGYAEGIRDGIFQGESATKGLDVIVQECERLKNIVTEMTLLSKLESEEGIFDLQPVAVAALAKETAERLAPLARERNVEIMIEGMDADPIVQADRDKLLQALLNVTGNAIRYAKSRVTIQYGKAEGKVLIRVTDDGPGFGEELLPRLFQRFVKGKDGETGLGLAISRAIVERCGGRIRAANQPDGGAVVEMSFPS